MKCRLHLIEDVEHAHSPGIDLAAYDSRDLSGCGHRLDALGNRADDVQVVSQARSHRIGHVTPYVLAASATQAFLTH
jgi:hypothetical protein